MQRNITPEELQRLISSDAGIAVVDVRKPHDYDADPVRIPGATRHLPDRVDEWMHDLADDREIVVYCVHGHAVSNGVLDRLRSAGCRARLVEGGLEAWKDSGGTTVTDAG